jgi:Cu-Zn family superoxide dismutase
VHGTHLHATGRCDPPGFTTAGGHLNPAARQHGLRNPAGPHLGDLPNLTVAANGTGRMEATIAATLTPGQAPLFDADGTALVVHAGPDDMVTDPAGNSGARIACTVIAAPTT